MEEKSNVGIIDKFKGFLRKKPITPSDQVDQYITENLPDYIERYNLAVREDLKSVDKRIEEISSEVSNLKDWKVDTEERVEKAKKKVKRLEKRKNLGD